MNFVICSQQHFDTAARAAPLVLPDSVIDFWGGVYLANPALSHLGITFEAFLAQPREILPATQFGALFSLTEFFERLPMLPKQRAVQERLDAADAGQLSFDLDQSQANQGAQA